MVPVKGLTRSSAQIRKTVTQPRALGLLASLRVCYELLIEYSVLLSSRLVLQPAACLTHSFKAFPTAPDVPEPLTIALYDVMLTPTS